MSALKVIAVDVEWGKLGWLLRTFIAAWSALFIEYELDRCSIL